MKSYKNITFAIIFIFAAVVCCFAYESRAQAYSFYDSVPAFGLYCESGNFIKSGLIDYRVYDPKTRTAEITAEYVVAADMGKETEFFLPFVGSAENTHDIIISADDIHVEAERRYGEVYTEENVCESVLTGYSSYIDESLFGTLYRFKSAESTTVNFVTKQNQIFIYDFSDDMTIVQNGKAYSFTCSNSNGSEYSLFVIDGDLQSVESNVPFQTASLTCREYVENAYSEYREAFLNIEKDFFYSQINRLLDRGLNCKFSDFFFNSVSSARYNALKFSVRSQKAETKIKITMPITVAVSSVYDPCVYKIQYISFGEFPVRIAVDVDETCRYVLESSAVPQNQSDGKYVFDGNSKYFFCVLCSSLSPEYLLNNIEKPNNKTTYYILAAVFGILALGFAVAAVFLKKENDRKNK